MVGCSSLFAVPIFDWVCRKTISSYAMTGNVRPGWSDRALQGDLTYRTQMGEVMCSREGLVEIPGTWLAGHRRTVCYRLT